MESSTVHIRRATPADAETIAAFNEALARESERRTLAPQVVRAGVRAVLTDHGKGVYYVAEQAGKIVGQLLLTREWSDWRHGWFWWIQSVYVAPAARGRGVYAALQHAVVGMARRSGDVCGLRLYVDQENKAAENVYRRLGFQPAAYQMLERDLSDGTSPSAVAAAGANDAPDAIPVAMPVPKSDGTIEIDLYCLRCGYNLRGLSGDPVRCPECGYDNPTGDLYLPADVITRQLRAMETPLAAAALALLLSVVFLAISILELTVPLGIAIVCMVTAGVWMARFRNSCEKRPDWLGAFVRYQLIATLMSALVCVPLAAGCYLFWYQRRSWTRFSDLFYPVALLLFGLTLVVILLGLKGLHRRLKASIEPLQREMAVRIARDVIRKRQARGRRG